MPKNLPLYLKYQGQYRPQSAHLEINLEDKTWDWEIDYNIGSGIPMDVWNRRVLWLSIDPRVTQNQLDKLEENPKFQHYVQQILENSTIEWDGRNHVGKLNEVGAFYLSCLEDMLWSVVPEGLVWDPEDWLKYVRSYDQETGIHYLDGIPVTPENLEKLFEQYPEEWEEHYIPGLHDFLRELAESIPQAEA